MPFSEEDDNQRVEAIEALRWPTRDMAANLMRVARGAGRPSELPQQIIDLAGMILKASRVSNAWGIWNEMQQVLQDAVPDYYELEEWDDHVPSVVRGALQVAASRLVAQRAQEAAGETEILSGVDRRQRQLDLRRQRLAESRRSAVPKRNARNATPKAELKSNAPAPAEPRRATPMDRLPGESTAAFMRRVRGH